MTILAPYTKCFNFFSFEGIININQNVFSTNITCYYLTLKVDITMVFCYKYISKYLFD